MGDNERTARLIVNIFDGTRRPIGSDVAVAITIDDGTPKRVVDHRPAKGPSGPNHVFDVDYFDNFGDRYSVIITADGYKDGGCRIKVSDKTPTDAKVMLLPKKATFKFPEGDWQSLKKNQPELIAFLTRGVSDSEAEQRYNKRMQGEPAKLAGFFNVTTALAKIVWPKETAFDYFKELIWDQMAQDRFYAYADKAIIEQATAAAERKEFSEEVGIVRKLFHSGSTLSYKQTQFGEADVQITFHDQAKRTIDGVEVDCVIVEPDIDYYQDIVAHGLGEVLPNAIEKAVGEHGLTDPERVYLLRWTAAQQAGLEFDPPYVISA
jgi:hypothetical protein